MPYCPECMRVFVEGKTECPSCHVPLQRGVPHGLDGEEPEPDLELVTVQTFTGPTAPLDSELAKNVLASEGIKCVLSGEGAAEMLPGIDLVRLLVREEDAERAREFLQSFFDNPPTFPDEPEEDGN